MLKNLKLKKYLKSNLNIINITKNLKHKTKFSTQLKNNNQIVNNLIKNLHIYERLKHIDVAYYHIKNLTKKILLN